MPWINQEMQINRSAIAAVLVVVLIASPGCVPINCASCKAAGALGWTGSGERGIEEPVLPVDEKHMASTLQALGYPMGGLSVIASYYKIRLLGSN
jgi:hypothetical protein